MKGGKRPFVTERSRNNHEIGYTYGGKALLREGFVPGDVVLVDYSGGQERGVFVDAGKGGSLIVNFDDPALGQKSFRYSYTVTKVDDPTVTHTGADNRGVFCGDQKAKSKKEKTESVLLKALVAPAPTIKGCVITNNTRVKDVATGQFRGKVAIAGTRPVERIYASSNYAEKLGAVLDMKDLKDLNDVAAYLRPGKKLKVGKDIFKQDKSLKPLAGEDGVEYWGWNVQNKHPGAENKWVFVAVQEKEE